MGVSGIPDLIVEYGERLRRTSDQRQQPLRGPTLGPDSPLSQGLSEAQQAKGSAAAEFAVAMDGGIYAAGEAAVTIGRHMLEYDRDGSRKIERLFLDQAAGTDRGD